MLDTQALSIVFGVTHIHEGTAHDSKNKDDGSVILRDFCCNGRIITHQQKQSGETEGDVERRIHKQGF